MHPSSDSAIGALAHPGPSGNILGAEAVDAILGDQLKRRVENRAVGTGVLGLPV